MAQRLLVLLALVAKPWAACQSGLPDPTTQSAQRQTDPGTLEASSTTTTPLSGGSDRATMTTRFLLHPSKFMPTDRPPTVPLKENPNLSQNDVDKRKLGAYYRTVYRGNATKSLVFASNESTSSASASRGRSDVIGRDVIRSTASQQQYQQQPANQSHISDSEVQDSQDVASSITTSNNDNNNPSSSSPTPSPMTTSSFYQYEDIEKVPWRQGHTHHNTKHHPQPPDSEPTEKAGPYFRPPSAISHKYKNFRVDPETPLDDIDPECWPHCRNATRGSKRKRKHSSNKKRKYYNYKLLYDTLKGDLRRQETEFYAWIFGATMLTLGSLTTLTSCFVFCFCSEKWRKRRQTRKYDKSGQYQRVDSVSSVVDSHLESQEHQDQLDSVTII